MGALCLSPRWILPHRIQKHPYLEQRGRWGRWGSFCFMLRSRELWSLGAPGGGACLMSHGIPLSPHLSLSCRCEVRMNQQQPFPGTRMYMACYIPEPSTNGAHCRPRFVLPCENCPGESPVGHREQCLFVGGTSERALWRSVEQ